MNLAYHGRWIMDPGLVRPWNNTSCDLLICTEAVREPEISYSDQLRVRLLERVPDNPSPALLEYHQLWVSDPQAVDQLEQQGIPRHRIRVVNSADHMLAQAEALISQYQGMTRPAVWWRGDFGRNSSLATVNSELIRELEQMGQPVCLKAPGGRVSDSRGVGIHQRWPVDLRPVTHGPQVTFAYWEYGAVPATWVTHARYEADHFWTGSDYTRQGMIECGMPPAAVQVVPGGVDLDLFCPSGERFALGPQAEGRTVFLFVGGTIWRKGPDILQQAWQEAFSPEDPVLLVIKDFGSGGHYKGQNLTEQLCEWADRDDHAPVQVLTEHLSADHLPALYRAADVMVLPYRAEGFCLPALEAMACGVPIIHPQVGPSNQFCQQAGWTVPVMRQTLPSVGDLELARPGWIHEMQPSDLAVTMRYAADPQARNPKAAAARAEAEPWSWRHAAEELLRFLDELRDEDRPPIRNISPAQVDHRGRLLVCFPQWKDPLWHQALVQTVRSLEPEGPITLACYHPDDEETGVGQLADILTTAGIDLDGPLCDLTVLTPSGEDPRSLVLAADAILTPEKIRPSDGLLRHAREMITPSEVSSWAEHKT